MWYKTNEDYVQIVKHRFLPGNFYSLFNMTKYMNMTWEGKKKPT